MDVMRPSIAVAPLALALAGCLHEEQAVIETGPAEPAPVSESSDERQLTIADDEASPAPGAPSPAVVAGSESPLAPDPVRFQIGAGYGALSRVDLGSCLQHGLPSGYLKVRATFTRLGYVVHASVASAKAPPPAALDCIADQLRQAGVPRFDGSDARLSKTYFVEPGGSAPAEP
jgi:hypothetical protein